MENDNGALIKKEWFIEGKDGKIEDFYSFDEKKYMGKGQYGVVVKAVQKSNNQIRAIKIIRKKKVKDPDRLRTEVTILKKIDHPNVVRLFQIYETAQKLYLVMQLCEGGEVFNRYLDGNRKADEATAKRIFRDVVNAIVYCHNHKICHRDLKPENLLLLSKNEPSSVKVIDFGLSAIFDQKERSMKTKAGTCYFISPEVLLGKYDESCDVWSLGVILYFLVSGVPPFYGQSEYEILEMVKKKQYTFDIPEFEGVCAEAKDLISRCLEPSNKRITAEAILHHPWLGEVEKPKSSLTMTLVDRFRNASKFKIIVLSYMATQLTYKELEVYQKMFTDNDGNHDGYLTYEELISILVKTGVSCQDEARKITELIDTDRNGKINYNEFLTATIRPEIYSQPAKVKKAFSLFDKTNKGYIVYEDIQRVIQSEGSMTAHEWNNVVKELDQTANGVLNYQTFERLMSKQ